MLACMRRAAQRTAVAGTFIVLALASEGARAEPSTDADRDRLAAQLRAGADAAKRKDWPACIAAYEAALAIDDSYMPAFNQLALYYFQQAKKRAGAVKSSTKGRRGRSIATNAAMGKRAARRRGA